MKPSVYLETTIVSYLAAKPSRDTIVAGHQTATHLWWEYSKDAYDLFVSSLVIEESEAGDADAASRRLAYLAHLPSLSVTESAKELAGILIKDRIIPQGYAEDAIHIAVCAIHNIDFLVTWNCRHLANALTRKRIEKVIQEQGFRCPVICTPEELMENNDV